MDREKVAALLATKKAELNVAQERVDALVAEREEAIRLSKAMRGALKDTEGMSQDIRAVARGLRDRAAEMDQAKALRDAENQRLVLPRARIEEELKRLYHTLTAEVDVFRVRHWSASSGTSAASSNSKPCTKRRLRAMPITSATSTS